MTSFYVGPYVFEQPTFQSARTNAQRHTHNFPDIFTIIINAFACNSNV